MPSDPLAAGVVALAFGPDSTERLVTIVPTDVRSSGSVLGVERMKAPASSEAPSDVEMANVETHVDDSERTVWCLSVCVPGGELARWV